MIFSSHFTDAQPSYLQWLVGSKTLKYYRKSDLWYFIRLQYGLFALLQASENLFPREMKKSQSEYMMVTKYSDD